MFSNIYSDCHIEVYAISIIANKRKKRRNGSKTNIHENQLAPARQNRFKIQVQNKI